MTRQTDRQTDRQTLAESINRMKVLAGINEAVPSREFKSQSLMLTLQCRDTERLNAMIDYISQIGGTEAEEGSPVIMFYPTSQQEIDQMNSVISKYKNEIKVERVKSPHN